MQFKVIPLSIFLIAGIACWLGCNFGQPTQVVFTSDMEGVYLYDLELDSSWAIAESELFYVPGSLRMVNEDVATVGYVSKEEHVAIDKLTGERPSEKDSMVKWAIQEREGYDSYFNYQEDYLAFDLNNKRQWLYQTKLYSLHDRQTMTITLTTFDEKGDTVSVADTSYPCDGYRITNIGVGIEFCDYDRFYSESGWVKGKQAFSRKGSIYLREGGKEKLLLEPEFGFDAKFGAGLFEPNISADGEKVIVRYNPGFLNGLDCLREIDLNTGKDSVVVYGTFYYPKYSPDGKYILFQNEQYEVYLYEPESKKFTYVGFGDMFVFR